VKLAREATIFGKIVAGGSGPLMDRVAGDGRSVVRRRRSRVLSEE
jgi:hypothetical protein